MWIITRNDSVIIISPIKYFYLKILSIFYIYVCVHHRHTVLWRSELEVQTTVRAKWGQGRQLRLSARAAPDLSSETSLWLPLWKVLIENSLIPSLPLSDRQSCSLLLRYFCFCSSTSETTKPDLSYLQRWLQSFMYKIKWYLVFGSESKTLFGKISMFIGTIRLDNKYTSFSTISFLCKLEIPCNKKLKSKNIGWKSWCKMKIQTLLFLKCYYLW